MDMGLHECFEATKKWLAKLAKAETSTHLHLSIASSVT